MNVPQLRFSGFDGEWETNKLGEITELTDGTHYTPDYKKTGIPFWSVETITTGTKPKFISKEAHIENIKRCKPEYDDILVTRISSGINSLGMPKLVDWNEEFSIYVSVGLIKSSPNFHSEFLSHYISSPFYKTEFRSKSLLTATPKKINMVDFKNTKVKLPHLVEQEKIAAFFTLITKRIEKQQEKIEKLEQFKKGMMQKIFSQELRFKDEDGGEFTEWQLKELKDIADIVGGGTPSTSHEGYWNGNIPWFTPTEISSEKYVSQSKRTISEEGLKKSSAKVLPVGTILLTTRATLGDMAIATVPVTTNQGFQSIIPKENSVSEFIYYLQPQIKKHCLVNASGSTFMEISKSNLETFTTLIPSKKEQIKISSYLSALDSKIEKEEEKLMVLEEQKRGFMWGMFV